MKTCLDRVKAGSEEGAARLVIHMLVSLFLLILINRVDHDVWMEFFDKFANGRVDDGSGELDAP